MKSMFQFLFLMCGVCGVDADDVKTVSVTEGDSVTLNPDLTEIQGINEILWRFEGPVIAQTDGTKISYPYLTEIFRDRLKLDHQTGSLTIKNMRKKHSGLYKLEIIRNSGITRMTFSVTVSESPTDRVIDAYTNETKSVSVMEGHTVSLQTDHVTETLGDELIVWRFGDEGKLIAKHDIESKSLTNYTDVRFRDRLKLDHQTGSLTITNTRTTDSGLYTVKISSNSKQTLYRFGVTVSASGLSPGVIAGIVVVLLLVFSAAVAGAIYCRRKTPELKRQKHEEKTVMVKEGEDLILNTDVKVQTDDEILWTFGPQENLIAEIREGARETYDGADGRFRDRLKLDETTGSLTITNTRNTASGLYKLQIKSNSGVSDKTFSVTVSGYDEERTIFGVEGQHVTLNTDTEVQKDELIVWMFGDQDNLIAQLTVQSRKTFDGADGRFRDRLQLDKRTGSLTIRNITSEHTGHYKLQIISSRGTKYKKFKVITHDSTGNTVNESATVEMPLLSVEEVDEFSVQFKTRPQVPIAETSSTFE